MRFLAFLFHFMIFFQVNDFLFVEEKFLFRQDDTLYMLSFEVVDFFDVLGQKFFLIWWFWKIFHSLFWHHCEIHVVIGGHIARRPIRTQVSLSTLIIQINEIRLIPINQFHGWILTIRNIILTVNNHHIIFLKDTFTFILRIRPIKSIFRNIFFASETIIFYDTFRVGDLFACWFILILFIFVTFLGDTRGTIVFVE